MSRENTEILLREFGKIYDAMRETMCLFNQTPQFSSLFGEMEIPPRWDELSRDYQGRYIAKTSDATYALTRVASEIARDINIRN